MEQTILDGICIISFYIAGTVGLLVAGEFISRPYALIQDEGGQAGRNHSVTIKPKHYFFKMAEESEPEVMKIYEEEVERIING